MQLAFLTANTFIKSFTGNLDQELAKESLAAHRELKKF